MSADIATISLEIRARWWLKAFEVDFATVLNPLLRGPRALRDREKIQGGTRVSSQLSVAQVLANLETQMELLRDQEAHHAAREVFHREQQTARAAELETVARHYEAFKEAAGGAAEIASRVATAEPPREEAPLPPLKPVRPSKLVARAVAEMPAGEAFAPTRIAAEVNRRYSRELRKPLDSRHASTALRRLMIQGQIRLVRKGTAHRETVYARG
jgi:hypothetical protein